MTKKDYALTIDTAKNIDAAKNRKGKSRQEGILLKKKTSQEHTWK
jgi:phage anti-repressor protein